MFSKIFFFISLVSFVLFLVVFFLLQKPVILKMQKNPWSVRSVDTMKYSRDLSAQVLHDYSFDNVIDKQMAAISKTGANYVAIDTPYDNQFLPVLSRWVTIARKHNLHIWFRGNFSGWEGWFNYPKMTPAQHLQMTQNFIIHNPDLFANGDIFTSCPECENGYGLTYADPAQTVRYKQFLLDEYEITRNAFAIIHKDVISNYYSMSKTAADAIMDRQTAAQFGGVIVIDHYVPTTKQLGSDIRALAARTGAKIVLGEFGAPIPDLNGNMTDAQQKQWLQDAFTQFSTIPQLIGMNYWTSVGGSTAIWTDAVQPKPAVAVLTKYYSQ